LNESIGQLLADASFQEGKWRAVRRALEAVVPLYEQYSQDEKTKINEAVRLGDAKAIRGIDKNHKSLEELSTHTIRDTGRKLKIPNWSRMPRFALIKKIKEAQLKETPISE